MCLLGSASRLMAYNIAYMNLSLSMNADTTVSTLISQILGQCSW